MMQLKSEDIFEDPNISKFELFPFQATAVQWMRWVENRVLIPGEMAGGILADDMGFGKTIMMSALCESNIVPTTLIVAPLSVINQIALQILKISKRLQIFTINDEHFFSIIELKTVNGIQYCASRKLYESKQQNFDIPGVLIVNREKLTQNSKSLNLIKRFNWYRILVDEAHMMRHGTDTTFYQPLCDIPQPMVTINGNLVRIGSRFAITGTPIQNDYNDLVNIFNFIDRRHVISSNNKLNDLARLIRTNLFRRNKNNITPEMKQIMKYPDKPPTIHDLPIYFQETQLSKNLENKTFSEIEEYIRSDGRIENSILYDERSFLIYMTAQIASTTNNVVNLYKTFLSYPYEHSIKGKAYKGKNTKVDTIVNLIKSKNGESFVIFHLYDQIKDVLKVILPQFFQDYIFLSIGGQDKIESRDLILLQANKHIEDGKKVIMFSSIKATSEGLNYQKFSNEIILDHNANPQEENQTINRVCRIGQENDVNIYFLSTQPFKNGYGIVNVDDRYKEIKEIKSSQADIIEQDNAAWFFRRYTYKNKNGFRESGVAFHPVFENEFKGKQNGPDSVGPREIR
jgi:SNF2 family DNA or RNA helicase